MGRGTLEEGRGTLEGGRGALEEGGVPWRRGGVPWRRASYTGGEWYFGVHFETQFLIPKQAQPCPLQSIG